MFSVLPNASTGDADTAASSANASAVPFSVKLSMRVRRNSAHLPSDCRSAGIEASR